MSLTAEQLVRRIHDAPTRIVLAVAGGGSRAIAALLEVPGATRTLLEAVVPYCERAMIDWLGGQPEQFCSEPTARAIAMAAYRRACHLASPGTAPVFAKRKWDCSPPQSEDAPSQSPPPQFPVAGVACTASLASDRPKRGPHRTHLAIQTAAITVSQSIEFHKNRRSRGEEEHLVSGLVLNAIAEACGLEARLDLELFPGERIDEARLVAPQGWQELLAGSIDAVCEGGRAQPAAGWHAQNEVMGVGSSTCPQPRPSSLRACHPAAAAQEAAPAQSRSPVAVPRAIFPGAFNPLHAGHRRMAEIARKRLGIPVEFEISVENVDKLPLDYLEIARRLEQFGRDQVVWLTRAATFDEKTALFPGATFVVGTDTLRRIAEPRYYGGEAAACRAALDRILARGSRFLVFGRQESGRFVSLADLDLPPDLKAACAGVPADDFHEDISSTALRAAEEA